jgi:hypothetical protein
MSMVTDVRSLAFNGDWDPLLQILGEHPELVNVASEPKGYTPLHQAAWHGADLTVIGQLLRLGASRHIRTLSRRQNAAAIAAEKHPEREDLAYVLKERRATIAQLLRMAIASNPGLFSAYDGNQLLADRMVACFGADPSPSSIEELEQRFHSAFTALTGANLAPEARVAIAPCDDFRMEVTGEFWTSRLLPLIRKSAAEAENVVLDRQWAVIADLFDPAPRTWGLRGDMFLWLEMRQALCLVPIPERPEAICAAIASALHALTGQDLAAGSEVFVSRYARGGMSSGVVSGAFWVDEFPRQIQNRARWVAGA